MISPAFPKRYQELHVLTVTLSVFGGPKDAWLFGKKKDVLGSI